jgi:glucosamine--fructose-6-phosphate aminotransferase (isomerizing)
MCGIAGYVGPRNAVEVVIDQLKRLEYRGYDSAGVAFRNGNAIEVRKKAGKLSNLQATLLDKPDSRCAIAHSRWATHGGPTDVNAHPHMDEAQEIALIHNGIIENYQALKDDLLKDGVKFLSQTDTEVAAQVIGKEYALGGTLEEAVRRATRQFRGAYAFVVVSRREPGKIVAVRNASPLIVGFGQGENMLASDIPALLPYTREVAIIPEGTMAVLESDKATFYDADGREKTLKTEHIEWDVVQAEREGYPHFMIKEIHEQPEVVRQCLLGRTTPDGKVELDGTFSDAVWNDIDRVNIIACGTAYHAGLMGKHLFEKLLRLPTDVYYSSEFRYGDPVLSPRSLAIFISQSGETADTLAALRLCKARRIRTLGIVNVVGSSIARECDRNLPTQAGPEISVASTKAYTAQVTVLTLLALHIAQVQEAPGIRVDEWIESLRRLPELFREALETEPQVKVLAQELKEAKLACFLGRGADAFVSYEAALKLKEIAYIPTQESPAGELKHGPLALVEPGVVAVFGATQSGVFEKTVSNMQEVRARGGKVLAITSDSTGAVSHAADAVVQIPTSGYEFLDALLSIVPLQLLAYYAAVARDCEVDQPRNLAKSVTVE